MERWARKERSEEDEKWCGLDREVVVVVWKLGRPALVANNLSLFRN